MPWETNPIILRTKQTTNWAPIPPDITNNKIVLQTLREVLQLGVFASFWLKHHQWYLLDFFIVNFGHQQLFYLTAFHLPKQRTNLKLKPYTRLSNITSKDDERINCIKSSLYYYKSSTMFKKHFKRRKALFKAALQKNLSSKKNFLRNKTSIQNKSTRSLLFNTFFKKKLLKKKWLTFLAGLSLQKATLSSKQFSKELYMTKQLRYTWRELQENVYGFYAFDFEGWEKIRLQKTIKRSRTFPKKELLVGRVLDSHNYFNVKPNKRFLLAPCYTKSFKKTISKVKFFSNNFKKVRFLSVYAKLGRLLSYSYKKRGKAKKKAKRKRTPLHLLFRKIVPKKPLLKFVYKRGNKYKRWNKKFFHVCKKWKYNRKTIKRNRYAFKKKVLRKYRAFYVKAKERKTRRQPLLQQQTQWRINFIKIQAIKNKIINKFLSLICLSTKRKKFLFGRVRKGFARRAKIRRYIFNHSFAIHVRSKRHKKWLKQKKKAELLAKNLAKKWRRRWVRPIYPPYPLFNFSTIRYIYQLRAVERQKTKKFRLSTFKMNFLFKKLLRKIFKIKDSGALVVRFLQPYGLLVSLQKFRRIARGIRSLTRYRRKISYKRLLPYMSILVRYWNPQPLLEQIAFEMEKTKKHWPILRIVRTVIEKLKPKWYTSYRFAIIGRIHSSKRTRKFIVKTGGIPISTFSTRVVFALCQANARIGSFGIKSWLYFKYK